MNFIDSLTYIFVLVISQIYVVVLADFFHRIFTWNQSLTTFAIVLASYLFSLLPDILLLDEPTNGLDEEARHMFAQLIREEKERGCTIVMASHIYEDLEISCDRLLEIDNGILREKVMS